MFPFINKIFLDLISSGNAFIVLINSKSVQIWYLNGCLCLIRSLVQRLLHRPCITKVTDSL